MTASFPDIIKSSLLPSIVQNAFVYLVKMSINRGDKVEIYQFESLLSLFHRFQRCWLVFVELFVPTVLHYLSTWWQHINPIFYCAVKYVKDHSKMRIHWLRIKKIHFKPVTFPCWKCYRRFCWKSRCNDHAANCQIGSGHSNRRGTPSSDFVLTSAAVADSVKVYAFNFPKEFIDIDMIDTLLNVNAANLILAELQRQFIVY